MNEAALALAQDLVPDVVLMDVRMPGMSGIDTTRRMAAALPSTRIIMLTVSDEEDDLPRGACDEGKGVRNGWVRARGRPRPWRRPTGRRRPTGGCRAASRGRRT